MKRPRIETARLILVASSKELLRLALTRPDDFSRTLNCRLPQSWPYDFVVRDGSYVWEKMSDDPGEVGWWIWWLMTQPVQPHSEAMMLGLIGLKGRPSRSGSVEMTYEIEAGEQGRGFVTEAALALLQWTFSHPEVKRAVATTTADNFSSRRVLEKCGFRLASDITDETELVFELRSDQLPVNKG